MDPSLDLEQTITDAVNDSNYDITPDPIEDTSTEPTLDTAADEPPPDAGVPSPSLDDAESIQAPTPAQAQENAPQDEFERLVGIPQIGVAGRENRIPYSRVKKITEKAVSEVAEAALGRKLNPGEKPIDVVKQHVAQLPQLLETTRDYEQRLNVVGQFENLMANEPQHFLQKLASLPAYAEFFNFVEKAYQAYEAGGGSFGAAQGQTPQAAPTVGQQSGTSAPGQDAGDEMPEPDEVLPDGSRQYSMEGVKQLLAWNSRQVTSKVTKDLTTQFDQRFKPMETEWQAQKRIEATLPLIRVQIAEARSWPMFNELEDEIVKALEGDKTLSLEAAYRKVAFPKILADRTKIKQDVMAELQRSPVSTSVAATRAATRPVTQNAGPRSLEDVIKDSVESLKR
jgi:hypothetical protein